MNNKGFTLLELLAVLALITVVSAISAPKIIETVANTKEQRIVTDMETITSALQRFCIEQELKTGNPDACELNGINSDGGIWHGADQSVQSQTITEAISKYLEKNVDKHFSVIITVDQDNWLTSSGYGSVSVWYPSVDENEKHYFLGDTRPTDFKENAFTKAAYTGLTKQQKMKYERFIFDIDGDGADDSNDFLVSNVLFKLNSIHTHTSTGKIEGTNDNDTLYGTDETDYMYGYGGEDKIYGYELGDILYGGPEDNDELYGGTENDILDGGQGDDVLNGGQGTDTAILRGSWTEYTITGDNPYTITGPSGIDTLIEIEYLQFDDRTGTVSDIIDDLNTYIFGTEGNDNPLEGTDDSDIIYGYGGNDVIYGYEDNDTIYAGEDDDEIHGGLGNDIINGEEGTDTVVYQYELAQYTVAGTGPYTITGPEGTDTLLNIEYLTFADITDTVDKIIDITNGVIHGTAGDDDPLMGTSEEDTIYGYEGNDVIYGLASDDTIDGGEDEDTAVFSSYWAYYTITGDDPKIITGPDGTDTLIGIEILRFKDEQTTVDEFEDKVGDIIEGTDGDDYLGGSWDSDVYMASEGTDYVNDWSGLDTIVFNGPIEEYTIYEDSSWGYSSVSDSNGNITYFFNWLGKTTLQFTNDVYEAD